MFLFGFLDKDALPRLRRCEPGKTRQGGPQHLRALALLVHVKASTVAVVFKSSLLH